MIILCWSYDLLDLYNEENEIHEMCNINRFVSILVCVLIPFVTILFTLS